MTALENEAVFIVTNWASEDTLRPVHRRAGIPLVLSSYGNHSCSMILLHSLKFGFFVHNGVSQ